MGIGHLAPGVTNLGSGPASGSNPRASLLTKQMDLVGTTPSSDAIGRRELGARDHAVASTGR
jgi:hypothetical protein